MLLEPPLPEPSWRDTATVPPWARAVVLASLAGLALACSATVTPAPEGTLRKLERALQANDQDALARLLTADARRDLGAAGVARVLHDSRAELLEGLRGAVEARRGLAARIRISLRPGTAAELRREAGGYRVVSDGALLGRPRTVVDALVLFRESLRERDASLLLLLTQRSRQSVERELDSLVRGLAHADQLPIELEGDHASVSVPGGHRVELYREDGVWKIHDFK